ncbi:hypothetical protein [Phyllobacterium sophorae]|uniref:hypothetical protein n=1 Tax=Phyllobacterium sophorae TaxID=1520277 RepID=UPI001FE0FA0B|nr:hypothetical protein [Phyllobacterium sophorae]
MSRFAGANLTKTLARIEKDVRGVTTERAAAFMDEAGAGRTVLAAAGEMKRLASQINVTIHALGILSCLPHILEEGEWVEYVSLGAGNTGRQFDLETNIRVAEFKFINWRGGAESIRQNSIFKDFFLLAEAPTPKRKYLYLLGTRHALRFLNGGRAISSVLSRGDKVQKLFLQRFGNHYLKARDYFQDHQQAVTIVDVSEWLQELQDIAVDEAADETAS